MKFVLIPFFIALLLLPGHAEAQAATPTPTISTSASQAASDGVRKTACVSTFAYPNLAALKVDLLAQAKRLAVAELYGEFIDAVTEVENFAVTSDQVRSLTSGFVRVRGSESYHNGTNLAEVCVAIDAYTTAEDRAKFQPVTISARNCVTEPNRPLGEVRRFAEEEVRIKALLAYDPRLTGMGRERVLRLLRRVAYSESVLLPGTDSYCATVSGGVTPVEVLALLDGMGTAVASSPALPTPTPTRTPTRQPTPTPTSNRALTNPEMTATASMATVIAFQSRTPTATPTHTATPNRTATAISATVQAIAMAEAATATAIAMAEAATATAIAGVAQAIATAQAQGIDLADIRIGPVDGALYVYVPEGEFIRGSETGESDEKPVQTIFVSGFWLKQTEVTNAEYGRCVQAKVCPAPDNSIWDDSDKAEHPVTHVSWNDAVAYAQWAGGRLPTEAEWEKGCRGSDGRSYAWGNSAPDSSRANFGDSSRGTVAVGSYPAGASPYGALDMAGNVWEWTADWYDSGYYTSAPARDPSGPTSGQYRVLRGGSFSLFATYVRCADRLWSNPVNRNVDVGFRVVLPPGF